MGLAEKGSAFDTYRRHRNPEVGEMSDEDLLAKYPKAVKRLQVGRIIREVAGECGLSTKTVQKIKTALKQ